VTAERRSSSKGYNSEETESEEELDAGEDQEMGSITEPTYLLGYSRPGGRATYVLQSLAKSLFSAELIKIRWRTLSQL
jgi:hypothetical protein